MTKIQMLSEAARAIDIKALELAVQIIQYLNSQSDGHILQQLTFVTC